MNLQEINEMLDSVVGRLSDRRVVPLAEGKMPKVTVYDAGDETVDRYTIVIQDKNWEANPGMRQFLGVDGMGGRSFSQFGECREGSHLGKKIKFSDLPPETQKHVTMRLTTDY
jgi:hypothetical protein